MPFAGQKLEELAASATVSDEAMRLRDNQSAEAPVAARPAGGEAAQNPPPQPGALARMDSSSMTGETAASPFRKDSKEQPPNESIQGPRITLPDMYNPMNPRQTDAEPSHRPLEMSRRGMAPEPSKSQLDLKSLPDKIRRRLSSSIKMGFNAVSEQRAKAEKQEASVDESPKPMLIPIRDKVFRFEKGMLIDQEYNPEMQKWRVWTLPIGSEAYKQVLANEPLLKEFFDRGPILIVWKNRIYKVLK
jgi:hypothetical protein